RAVADGNAAGVFTVGANGIVNVGEEGALDFTHGTLEVDGLVNIHGGMTLESGTDLTGDGTVDLSGGSLLVVGGMADVGKINFGGKKATPGIDDTAQFFSRITALTSSQTHGLVR